MTRHRIDADQLAGLRVDLERWLLMSLHPDRDPGDRTLRSLRVDIELNRLRHIYLGLAACTACTWAPPVIDTVRHRTDGLSALVCLVLMAITLRLLLRRFGRRHAALLARLQDLEDGYCARCLEGVERVNWHQVQALVRLRCLLDAELSDRAFRDELAALLDDPDFPQLPLRHVLRSWVAEVDELLAAA